MYSIMLRNIKKIHKFLKFKKKKDIIRNIKKKCAVRGVTLWGDSHHTVRGDVSHLRYVTRTAIFCDSVCVTSPACDIQCAFRHPHCDILCALRHPHAIFCVRCVTRMRYCAIRHPTFMRYVTLWGRVTHRIGIYIYKC